MQLEQRSLTELRMLAQAVGAKFSFADDALTLRNKIDKAMEPEEQKPPIPAIQVRTLKQTKKYVDEPMMRDALRDYIALGLRLEMTPDGWEMRHGKKVDTGTLHMPIRAVIQCAQRLMG